MTDETMATTPPSVAVFGAGIAGLATAHELIELGFRVAIYEITDSPGGFAKSSRMPADGGMPSEYSWRGFGPWYHNAFDLMRRIPDGNGTIHSKQLSQPIRFAMPRDRISSSDAQASDDATQLRDRFQFTWRDILALCLAFLRTAVADERAMSYASVSAAEYMQKRMSPTASAMLAATFGPWIGIDPINTSIHHAGLFFRKNFFPGSGSIASPLEGAEGWRVLRAPSNESWFDPWVRHLQSKGVEFHFREELERLSSDRASIILAQTSRNYVRADYYVMAVTPFASEKIFTRSGFCDFSDLAIQMSNLTTSGPHVQVSFRIGFSERVNMPADHTAVILPDSEYNITLLPVDTVWHPGTDLGEGIQSLWTGTACVSYVPGKLGTHDTVGQCSKEQFIAEVLAQVFSSQGLDAMIRTANHGRPLRSFEIARTEVWHEWVFDGAGVRSEQPKWVNFLGTQRYRPSTATSVQNLFLAGAHVKTDADIWSMEGAVESGRRAAFAVAEAAGYNAPRRPIVIRKPWWMRAMSAADNWLYRKNLPSAADIGCVTCLALILVLVWLLVR